MIFRKLIGLGFLAIMLFAFLGAFGTMRQSRTNTAWTQGYIAGQQAAAGEDDAVNTAPPTSPYGYDTYYRSHRGFFPGIGLFLCLLPLMFFGGLFLLFGGKRRWRHGPGSWHHHGPCHGNHPWKGGHKQGGEKPPWVDDNDLNDEPVMKA